jgi:TolB-like protein
MTAILARSRWLLAALVVPALSLSAMAATRVVVLPFTGSTPEPARDAWIAKAVQQNIIMTLGQARGLEAVASKGNLPAVIDSGEAVKAAKAANATFAIFGSYEIVGDQIRFTAHLVDTTGQSFGMARTGGGVEKLLSWEDQLGEQLRQAAGDPVPALDSVDRSHETAKAASVPENDLAGAAGMGRQVLPAVPLGPVVGGGVPINFLSVVRNGGYYGGMPMVSVNAVNTGFSRSYSSGLEFSWGLQGKNWSMNFNGSAGQGLRTGNSATGVMVGGH